MAAESPDYFEPETGMVLRVARDRVPPATDLD
jgi:hypothetical protein